MLEPWWRVTRPSDGHVTWTPEDPSDRLVAAWEGATVEGPFVRADAYQGAVELIRDIGQMAGAKATGADARAMAKRAREFSAAFPRQSLRTEGDDR